MFTLLMVFLVINILSLPITIAAMLSNHEDEEFNL